MDFLILMGISLLVSTLFIMLIHYVINPLVKLLYYSYEPLAFHYRFKIGCRIEKVKRLLGKSTPKRPH